jgi:predicted HTH domain antitoxin
MSGICSLYRHYDSFGELLYVGISLNALNRLSQHREVSAWFSDIVKVTIQSLPNRHEALEAETKAILEEQPKYNIQKRKKKKEILEGEQKTSTETARVDLVRKVVSVRPIYKLNEAARFLDMRPMDFMTLVRKGRIKTIALPYKQETKEYVTGFQLIDFLEQF